MRSGSSIRISSTSMAGLSATRPNSALSSKFRPERLLVRTGFRRVHSSAVSIEDEVFFRLGFMFINGKYRRATKADGRPRGPVDWTEVPTRVSKRASIALQRDHIVQQIGVGAIVSAGTVVMSRRCRGGRVPTPASVEDRAAHRCRTPPTHEAH